MSVTTVNIKGYKIQVTKNNRTRAEEALARDERARLIPKNKKYTQSNAFAMECVIVADKFGSLEAERLMNVGAATIRYFRARLRKDGLYHPSMKSGPKSAQDHWPLMAARLLAQHDACVRGDSGAGRSAAMPQTQL